MKVATIPEAPLHIGEHEGDGGETKGKAAQIK